MAMGITNTRFIRDNRGRYWIVDFATMRRYEVSGTGAMAAARHIWGNPLTSASQLPDTYRRLQQRHFGNRQGILLDTSMGYVPGGHITEAFGGGNQMERYIAGQIANPFTGRLNANPTNFTAGNGDTYTTGGNVIGSGEIEDARDYLKAILSPYGLDTDEIIELASNLMIDGANETIIWAAIKETDLYKDRFKGNIMRIEAGLPELSPQAYLAMEQSLRNIMASADLPPGFYDNPDDFHAWIGSGVGPELLADRINRGVRQVLSAPAAVRAYMQELIPGAGDQGLLAYWLDPDRATPVLENMALQALAVGWFDTRGWDVGPGRAQAIANRAQQMGLNPDQFGGAVQESLDWIDQRSALFTESVSEGTDLQEGLHGARATLLGDTAAQRAIQRRLQRRLATQQGAGGAASTTGATTLGKFE